MHCYFCNEIFFRKSQVFPTFVLPDCFIFLNLPYFLEPNAPPGNVRRYNSSSTSIVVQWDEVPANERNGIIKGYNVTYKNLTSEVEKTQTVDAPTRQVNLTGLNEFTKYDITVSAFTVKGGGPPSSAITVTTDEDSK